MPSLPIISGNLITVNAGTYQLRLTQQQDSLVNNEIRLVCKSNLGAINIVLPKIASLGNSIGLKLFVDDTTNTAGVNSITFTVDPADTIANASNFKISSNGGKAEIYISSRNEWGTLTAGGGNPPMAIEVIMLPVQDPT